VVHGDGRPEGWLIGAGGCCDGVVGLVGARASFAPPGIAAVGAAATAPDAGSCPAIVVANASYIIAHAHYLRKPWICVQNVRRT
jgi:hypothetical protein